MFAIIVNGIYIGLWKYVPGQIFFDDICKNLNLNKDQAKVLYFSASFEKLEGNFDVTESELIIYDRPVSDEQKVIVQSFIGEVYFENGVMIKPC